MTWTWITAGGVETNDRFQYIGDKTNGYDGDWNLRGKGGQDDCNNPRRGLPPLAPASHLTWKITSCTWPGTGYHYRVECDAHIECLITIM